MATLLKRWDVEKPILDVTLKLGEGPLYDEATDVLTFVDIQRHQVHKACLSTGAPVHSTLQLDVPVSFIALVQGHSLSEKVLVGLKYGLAVLDSTTGNYDYLAKLDLTNAARIRTNDGAVGPDGSVWFGTMTDFGHESATEGALFRYSRGKLETVLEGLGVPNGIAWSPENDVMYFIHTSARQILVFRYSSDGDVSEQAVFYQHDGSGFPDGLRVDVEGNLWVAIWGEGCVLRISRSGAVTAEVILPTRFATCTEFAGTKLFITTAADEDGDERSRRHGGALYQVDVGIRGVSHHAFDLVPGHP